MLRMETAVYAVMEDGDLDRQCSLLRENGAPGTGDAALWVQKFLEEKCV